VSIKRLDGAIIGEANSAGFDDGNLSLTVTGPASPDETAGIGSPQSNSLPDRALRA
jgi:hypothetical protein